MALSCAWKADTIPYLLKYQEIQNVCYKLFQNSQKNTATLSQIQMILNRGTKTFKIMFHCAWLVLKCQLMPLLLTLKV